MTKSVSSYPAGSKTKYGKKVLSVLLTVVMLIGCFGSAFTAFAEDELFASGSFGDNSYWKAVKRNGENNLTLIAYGEGEILGSINDRATIGSLGIDVHRIIVEPGITVIGDGAFDSMNIPTVPIIEIQIPNTVVEIGIGAFAGIRLNCDLVIPDSVVTIGERAFDENNQNYVPSTINLTLGNSVETIGDRAFAYCQFSGSLVLPNTLKTIGNSAFMYNRFTGDLIIPDSVTTIGSYAFYGFQMFDGNLILGNSVETIGNSAFSNSEFYNVNNTLYVDSDGCSFNGSLSIPDSVKSIGEFAFTNCKNFTSLHLGNGVESIGRYAFYGCTGFSGDLSIPNSITSIGGYAFAECAGFDGVLTLSNNQSFTIINFGVFKNCSNLTGNIVIPNNVKSIYEEAFYHCSGFNGTLTLSNALKSIGPNAFALCTNLTGNCVVPNTTTKIDNRAFYRCGFDGNLTLSNQLKTIGDEAFNECHFVGSLTIPNSVETIGYRTFYSCTFDDQLIFDHSSQLYSIGKEAFASNFFTKPFSLPEQNIEIGKCAFHSTAQYGYAIPVFENHPDFIIIEEKYRNAPTPTHDGSITYYVYCADCNQRVSVEYSPISYIYITNLEVSPNSVTLLPQETQQITTIVTPHNASNPNVLYESSDSIVASVDNTGLITAVSGGEAIITVRPADGTETIIGTVTVTVDSDEIVEIANGQCGDDAWWKLYSNGTLDIYGTGPMWDKSYVGQFTYYSYMSNIKNVVVEEGITSIGNYAFGTNVAQYGYTSLKHVSLADSVSTIGTYAFANSSLEGNIRLSNGLTEIKDYAFNNCSSITGITTFGNSLQTIGQSTFFGCSQLSGNLIFPDSIKTVGYKAFDNCINLDGTLQLGEAIEKIDSYAFRNCSNLKGTLNFTNALTKLGEAAFDGCSSLTGSLSIPSSIQDIDDAVFRNCSGFNGTLTLNNSGNWIESSAFENCTGFIGDLVIPENVTNIEERAFYNCRNLSGTLTIDDSVNVESCAFHACAANNDIESFFGDNLEKFVRVKLEGDLLHQGTERVSTYKFYCINCSEYLGQRTETLDQNNAANAETIKLKIGALYDVCTNADNNKLIFCENGTFTPAVFTASPFETGKSYKYFDVDWTVEAGSTEGTTVRSGITFYGPYISYYGVIFCGFDGTNVYFTMGGSQANSVQFEDQEFPTYYDPDSTITLDKNLTKNVGIAVVPENANLYNTVLSSKKPSVVSYDSENDTITTNRKGTAILEYSYEDADYTPHTVSWTINVVSDEIEEDIDVTNISADPSTISLSVGDTDQIVPIVLPDDATDPSVTFVSSDPTIAEVDENGNVTGIAPGSATVTITANDGSGLSTTVPVTITKKNVAKPDADTTAFVYDGTEKTYVVTGSEYYTVANNTRTNAGSQNVSVTLNDATKYQWTDGTTDPLSFVFTIAKAQISGVVVQDYTGAYDGNPHTITVIAPENAVVTYSTTENGSYDSDPITVTGSKTDDDTVTTIWFKVDMGDNYETFVGSGTVTINHVDTTGISVEQDAVLLKIGDTETLEPTVEPENATNPDLTYTSSDPEVATVDPDGVITAIGEGNAVITITSDDDPSITATVDVTVTKINVAVPAADNTVFVYDGTEKTYQIPENALYIVSGNKQTDANTYTVSVTLNDPDRYQWDDGNSGDTRTYSFIINRADASLSVPTGKTVDFNRNVQPLANPGSTTDGTIEYKVMSVNDVAQDNEWFEDVPSAKNAGTYVIAYQVIPDANHNAVAGGTFVTVINKVDAVIDQVPTGKTLDYERDEQELATPGSTEDGTVMYRITKVNDEPQDNEWQNTLPVAQNAGTYDLEYYVKGDENHDDSDIVAIASIINKVDAIIDVIPEGKTLDYEEAMQELAEAGETEDGTIMYKITEINGVPQENDWSDELPEAEDIGTYTIAYYIEGDENHDDSPVQTFVAEIRKLPASIQSSPTAKDLTYNGEFQELVNAGVASEGDVQYKITQINGEPVENSWSTTIPAGKNVGVYEVSYRVVPDEYNPDPEVGTTNVTISKANVEKPAVDSTEYKYDGTEKTYVISASEKYTVTNNKRTDAGSQIVNVSLNDTNNYQWTDGTIADLSYEFVIAKATIEGIAVQDYTGNYDGDPHTITVIVPVGATVTYSDTENGEYSVDPIFTSGNKDETTVTTIWFKVENGDNYEPFVGSGVITINHVVPTGITVSQDDITMKIGDTKTLDPVVEPENASNPALTYSSSDPTVATVDENGNVTAVGNGEAVITITSQEDDSIKTEVNVTVYTPTTGIDVEDTPVVIKVGETKEIPASAEPDNAANPTLSYSTDDEDVASVDGNKITGVTPGTTTLTIETADGIKKEIEVIVADASASYDKTELTEGETATLTVGAIPSDVLTVKNIDATSSDPTVATVDDNGNVTAVEGGNVTITLNITLEDENGTEVVVIKTVDITVNHKSAEPVQEPTHDDTADGTYEFDIVTYCKNHDNTELERETVELEKHDAVDSTVNTVGNIEYYKDKNSDDTYIWDETKGSNGEYVKVDDVTIPAIVPEHVDRVEPTDDGDGNIEYYHVGDNKYIKDDDGKYVPVDDVVLHNRERYEQQNIHHDEVGEPDRFDLVTLCTNDDYEFGRKTITLTKHEAVDPTVNEIGNIEYYTGSDGKTYIWDNDANKYIETDNVTIPKVAVETVDGTPATETDHGTKDHFKDADDNLYVLENGKYVPVTEADLVIHNIVTIRVNEEAVGCVTNGSYDEVRHCTCNGCDQDDEFVKHVTIPALGHDWTVANEQVTVAPTCTKSGTKTIEFECSRCHESMVKTESLKALGHTDEDKDAYCDRCHEQVGFRCSKCDWYDENKDKPGAFGVVVKIIHVIVHFVESINRLT